MWHFRLLHHQCVADFCSKAPSGFNKSLPKKHLRSLSNATMLQHVSNRIYHDTNRQRACGPVRTRCGANTSANKLPDCVFVRNMLRTCIETYCSEDQSNGDAHANWASPCHSNHSWCWRWHVFMFDILRFPVLYWRRYLKCFLRPVSALSPNPWLV